MSALVASILLDEAAREKYGSSTTSLLILPDAIASFGNGSADGQGVALILFWSPTCPHCAQEKKEFIPYVQEIYPNVRILMYNVFDEKTLDVLTNLSERIGFNPQSVPITIIGNEYTNAYEYYIGYGSMETTGRLLEGMIKRACGAVAQINSTCGNQTPEEDIIEVPFFGRVNLRELMGQMGVPLSTIALGLLDGFNPCAFFVLTMLLSFMVYAKSRTKMLAIGLTFVFIS